MISNQVGGDFGLHVGKCDHQVWRKFQQLIATSVWRSRPQTNIFLGIQHVTLMDLEATPANA
jgi:hypothetical protein